MAAPAATLRHKSRPIEQIALGDRVLAGNPEGARPEAEVDPATWRRVDLVMNSDGVVVDIALLRSPDWFEECGAAVGGTVPLSISELGLDGPARVVSITRCPTLKPGSGRVVTGTFSHDSGGVVDLRVDGRVEPLGVTQGHLVYSEDRRSFVAVGDLSVGESLSPLSGSGRVTGVSPRAGVHRVYNLEVNVEHVYHVTEQGLLVHNGCPIWDATAKRWRDPDTGRFVAAPNNTLRTPSSVIGKSDGGPGTWKKSPKRTKGQDYQEQISGVQRGSEYEVNGSKFDGYDANRNTLLDSKDWQSYPPVNRQFWHDNTLKEARSQLLAANGTAIEWHFTTQAAADAVKRLFNTNGITGIKIIVTPKNP